MFRWERLAALVFFLILCMLATIERKPDAPQPIAYPKGYKHIEADYVIPPEGTKSLIKELRAIRNNDGSITIAGKALLPKNTRLLITLKRGKGGGQDKITIDGQGNFSAGPFSDRGKSIKPGGYQVQFNSGPLMVGTQPPEVIALIGRGGSKLPEAALVPWDKEFPDDPVGFGRHVSMAIKVVLPPLTDEQVAIEFVRESKLKVEGKGQSHDRVREIVAWFEKSNGFKGDSWSATKSNGKWVVTLACTDGRQSKEAQWEYESKANKVRYLNSLAKLLSWLPPK